MSQKVPCITIGRLSWAQKFPRCVGTRPDMRWPITHTVCLFLCNIGSVIGHESSIKSVFKRVKRVFVKRVTFENFFGFYFFSFVVHQSSCPRTSAHKFSLYPAVFLCRLLIEELCASELFEIV